MVYLAIAYALIAIVLVAYTATMYRRTAQVERRMREIEQDK